MAVPGPVLREAHRLRRHIHELETRIAQAPRQLKVQRAKLQSAEDNLKAAQDEIKQIKVKTHDREGTIKATYGQIAKWEKQREGVENKKEFDALNHELAQAAATVKALEDEVFELMTLVEDKIALLPGVEAITKQVKAEVAQFEKEYDDRLAKFAAEKEKAVEELKAVDVQFSEDHRAMYLKLVGNRGHDALASIENGICTACYTELTPQNNSEIKRGMFVLCKSCGRILYV